jgi:hypothetical protein
MSALGTSSHRVLMQWDLYAGVWHVSFLEGDCRTPLPLKLTFQDENSGVGPEG